MFSFFSCSRQGGRNLPHPRHRACQVRGTWYVIVLGLWLDIRWFEGDNVPGFYLLVPVVSLGVLECDGFPSRCHGQEQRMQGMELSERAATSPHHTIPYHNAHDFRHNLPDIEMSPARPPPVIPPSTYVIRIFRETVPGTYFFPVFIYHAQFNRFYVSCVPTFTGGLTSGKSKPW